MSRADDDRDDRAFTLGNVVHAMAGALVATALAIALTCALAAIALRHPAPIAPELALRGSLR